MRKDPNARAPRDGQFGAGLFVSRLDNVVSHAALAQRRLLVTPAALPPE